MRTQLYPRRAGLPICEYTAPAPAIVSDTGDAMAVMPRRLPKLVLGALPLRDIASDHEIVA